MKRLSGDPMTRFVVDASAVLQLASRDRGPTSTSSSHRRSSSQALSALHEAVPRGESPADVARERLARIGRMRIRLLGDAVLRRRAWDLADRLGWASTYDAEYVALTQLQADALVTLDAELARSVEGIVATRRSTRCAADDRRGPGGSACEDRARARRRERGLVRGQRARREVGQQRDAWPGHRLRRQAGVARARLPHPGSLAGPAEWHVPRREPSGGLPRRVGRVCALDRKRGASAQGLGLRPLSAVDAAHLRRRRRRAVRDRHDRQPRRRHGDPLSRQRVGREARCERARGDVEAGRGLRQWGPRSGRRTARGGCRPGPR